LLGNSRDRLMFGPTGKVTFSASVFFRPNDLP